MFGVLLALTSIPLSRSVVGRMRGTPMKAAHRSISALRPASHLHEEQQPAGDQVERERIRQARHHQALVSAW
jgi:hypothetical protein